MKPKANKFRIRRSPAAQAQSGAEDTPRQLNPMEEAALAPPEDGFSEQPFPTASQETATEPEAEAKTPEVSPEEEIATIRQEGLTGRQLRMARRVAQKHGLPATSDFDAVRLLRREGIDPFQRATMLELVSAEGDTSAEGIPRLPKTIDKPNLPLAEGIDPGNRVQSIMNIQRDIAKRRRRKLAMLTIRLAFFVLLPTLIAGYYYFRVATPMYATKSEFVIQQADGGGGAGMGSLFSGSGLATSQDSITVQSYLMSRDAMLRLDKDVGFKAHFSQAHIDPIQRLQADATNEAAYKLYKRNVKIGYDPTEGIIKMEVVAASPEISALYSEALISYAETRVDNLTQRKREDQMQGARDSFEEAELKMLAAQAEVLQLQEKVGVFDATGESSSVMSQISAYETQLLDKKLQLQQLLDNARPNQARVDGAKGDIKRLEVLIAELRAKLTENTTGNGSLASISGRLTIAQTNLQTRTLLMQQSLEQLESARIEANKQTRYLSLGVTPVAPDEPTYPRALENTLLAFLIFSGIYLMVSLTASILREQVSS